MLALVRLAVVVIAVVMLAGVAFAGDAAAASTPEGVSAASPHAMPLVLAQSSDSSSSGSYRVPRGLIRLAIFGAIALFGAGAWVVRQMSGS